MANKNLSIECPKSSHDNLAYRCWLLERAKNDVEAQAALMERCKRDQGYWFDAFAWTYDPREENSDIPFILYPFQREYIAWLEDRLKKKRDGLTEKTRDMGATWCYLGWILHHWLFDKSFQALIGSRKEDLVDALNVIDSLFEKIRYMLRRLPKWMLPEGFTIKADAGYLKIVSPKTGSAVVGESTNENFSRQGRYNVVVVDEFAFVGMGDSIWQGMGDSTPSRMVVSTPKGKFNKFARLARGEEGNVDKFTLHWKDHPKKDVAWYENEKLRRTDIEVAEELDINYVASAGTPFYKGYTPYLHKRKLAYNQKKIIYRGLDFGFHHPCCVWGQEDEMNRFMILAALMGDEVLARQFAKDVIAYENRVFRDCSFDSFCDPAGTQVSDKSEKTSIQIFAEEGIPCRWRQSTYRERKEIIEGKLRTLIGGIPELTIHESVVLVHEGFEGGYHYPEKMENKREKEIPYEDGYYEHPMNCIEYIMVNLYTAKRPLTQEEQTQRRKRKQKERDRVKKSNLKSQFGA